MNALFDSQIVKLSGERALISKIGAGGIASIAEYTKREEELQTSMCMWCELLLSG